ncbi:MAG: YkgJ family cysteine cluster protein [Bryobacterales bacterium]|nr:YkgJ family cysteine cluster protein [Bryobacterales bacterium]
MLRIIDEPLALAAERAGEGMHCRKGCFGCCIGPFPITLMDAARLRAGLAALPEEQRERIVQRAEQAVAELRNLGYPGDGESGLLTFLHAEEILFAPPYLTLPCPVLDLESGACTLYEYRPIACRTYGLAITLDGKRMPHCPLNYKDVPGEAIEAARVEIETSAAGKAALDEFLTSGGREGQTVIAFALTAS